MFVRPDAPEAVAVGPNGDWKSGTVTGYNHGCVLLHDANRHLALSCVLLACCCLWRWARMSNGDWKSGTVTGCNHGCALCFLSAVLCFLSSVDQAVEQQQMLFVAVHMIGDWKSGTGYNHGCAHCSTLYWPPARWLRRHCCPPGRPRRVPLSIAV